MLQSHQQKKQKLRIGLFSNLLSEEILNRSDSNLSQDDVSSNLKFLGDLPEEDGDYFCLGCTC